jgi:hypothetical protein
VSQAREAGLRNDVRRLMALIRDYEDRIMNLAFDAGNADKIERLQRNVREREAELRNTRANLRNTRGNLQNTRAELRGARAGQNSLRSTLQKVSQRRDKARGRADELQSKVRTLQSNLANAARKINNAGLDRDELKKLRAEQKKLQADLAKVRERRNKWRARAAASPSAANAAANAGANAAANAGANANAVVVAQINADVQQQEENARQQRNREIMIREAREAAAVPEPRQRQLSKKEWKKRDVPALGDCLFEAAVVSWWSARGWGIPSSADREAAGSLLRSLVARHIENDPENFAPFLTGNINNGSEAARAVQEQLQLERYYQTPSQQVAVFANALRRQGCWGGHLAVTALAAVMKARIRVYGDAWSPEQDRNSYHLHGYNGLREYTDVIRVWYNGHTHYQALLRIDDRNRQRPEPTLGKSRIEVFGDIMRPARSPTPSPNRLPRIPAPTPVGSPSSSASRSPSSSPSSRSPSSSPSSRSPSSSASRSPQKTPLAARTPAQKRPRNSNANTQNNTQQNNTQQNNTQQNKQRRINSTANQFLANLALEENRRRTAQRIAEAKAQANQRRRNEAARLKQAKENSKRAAQQAAQEQENANRRRRNEATRRSQQAAQTAAAAWGGIRNTVRAQAAEEDRRQAEEAAALAEAAAMEQAMAKAADAALRKQQRQQPRKGPKEQTPNPAQLAKQHRRQREGRRAPQRRCCPRPRLSRH